MAEEGVMFRTNSHVGVNVPLSDLREGFEAVVLAGGSTTPRDLKVPGRELTGIYFAMEYLTLQNKRCEGDEISPDGFITAEGKDVIIIGGGDTGADCLGTVHRQGARSVRQLELLSRPPDTRAASNPWPLWPNIFRVSSAHEEGGERMYSISTDRFSGDAAGPGGNVKKLHGMQVETVVATGRMSFAPVAGSEFELNADLVLLAMGFVGPERHGLLDELGVKMTDRGTVSRDENWMTSVRGVFTAGDMQRGQSLIVWAIAEGRSCARGVDTYLMGTSDLPAPVS
jgi:glutamate synthase (NADPH/NADH) small chain